MKIKKIAYMVGILLIIHTVSAGLAENIYTPITSIICEIFSAVISITGALAAAVFMIAGIKWVASRDDAGARNAARTTMIHAIVGLIIVLLAKTVVGGITAKKLGISAAQICA